MTENPKLEDMGCDNIEEKGSQELNWVSPADDMTGLMLQQQYSNIKSESIVVDMERFSHLLEKDINSNSGITLQRNLSRKGSIIRNGGGCEKKTNPIGNNIGNESLLATSPRAATLHGGSSTPEKPGVKAVGATDHHPLHHHHQITIANGACEGKLTCGRRFGFRRNSTTWSIDPRRILLFFATLSCMGTIVLIYFTLSMTSKLNNGDDNN